jgi:predicted GNAT family N-acyltransferase
MTITLCRVDENDALFACAKHVRFDVFVDEQGVDPAREIDDTDKVAIHFVAFLPRHSEPRDYSVTTVDASAVDVDAMEAVGTVRVFIADKQPLDTDTAVFKIGRMAVKKAYRRFGVGRVLMQAAEQAALDILVDRLQSLSSVGKSPIKTVELHLNAQWDKHEFYIKAGFAVVLGPTGEIEFFDEEGMAHVAMTKTIRLPQ